MIHLEEKELQWHHRLMKTKGMMKKIPWEEYVKEMKAKFHNDEYEDF